MATKMIEIDIDGRMQLVSADVPEPLAIDAGRVVPHPIREGAWYDEIEWTPDAAVRAVIGAKALGLGAAVSDITSGKPVVEFRVPQGRRTQRLVVTCEGRPALMALWQNARDRSHAVQAARSARWEADRADLRSRIVADCPAGHILAAKGGTCDDGWTWSYTWDGHEFQAGDFSVRGLGLCYIPRDIAEKAIREAEERAKAEAERQATIKREADEIAAERRRRIDEAKRTGKPVELDHWMTETCHSHEPDCSFDAAAEIAMPDGTVRVEYTHCF